MTDNERDGYKRRWLLSLQVRAAEQRGDMDEARRLLRAVYADARAEVRQ